MSVADAGEHGHPAGDLATAQWRRGDRAAALHVAFVDTRPAMLAIARRIAREDAADVVQDALLRVWNNPQRFDETRGTLGAYLLVTTRGAALDHVRQIERRRRRELRAQTNLDLHRGQAVIDVELQLRLAAALRGLQDDQRLLVTTAFFERVSYRQIASTLGLPEGTVKSRIRRILTRLRHDIQPTGDVDVA